MPPTPTIVAFVSRSFLCPSPPKNRVAARPYAAVVVGPRGFDSLTWVSERPDGVLDLHIGNDRLKPTGLTLENWEHRHEL